MKKLAKYLKPYLLLALISPIMMMGEALADLLMPRLMSVIVDVGILGATEGESAESARTVLNIFFGEGTEYTPMRVIFTVGGVMLLLLAVGGLFGMLSAFTAAKAAQGFGHDLRRDAYSRVMSLSIEQTDKFTTGSLVTRMTNDIVSVTDFVEMLLRMFVRAPVFFVGGAIMLFALDTGFGAIILCALPVLAVLIYFVLKRATPLFDGVQTKLDRVNSVLQENVSGARVVKAYVGEKHERARFERANTELREVNYRVLCLLALLTPVLSVMMNAAVVAVLLIGGLRAGDSGISVGNIMAAVTYVTQVLMSVMMVTMMFQSVSRAVASGRRVVEVLDAEPVISGGKEHAPCDTASSGVPAVRLDGVSFHYPGTTGRPVLNNINLEVKRGEFLAIIGATGAGKTSLVSLIPRFYDPDTGTVDVNGVDVRRCDLDELRSKIGFVMQKSELFSGSIADNIRWGKPDASDEEVCAAAQTAQAAGFIESFAESYNTQVSEKGTSLSGGQKQRVSIARALIRRPEILIFDDATSALDLETEARLHKALRESLGGTTVIMIAQRIASVMGADRIAVIEDGTIKNCAPHGELLKISAAYRDIYASQMKSGALTEGGEVNE